jgi:hypothetical protein
VAGTNPFLHFFDADPVVGLGAAVSPWAPPPERRYPCRTDSLVHRCSVYHRRRRRHVRLLPVVRVLFLPTQHMGSVMCAACLLPLRSVHDFNDWCRGEEGIKVAWCKGEEGRNWGRRWFLEVLIVLFALISCAIKLHWPKGWMDMHRIIILGSKKSAEGYFWFVVY